MNYFCCKDITKNYKDYPVIRDISIAIKRGEISSILGPSGVGKTTLFNILAGSERPDGGTVHYNGEDITGKIGRVSYMQQNDLLLPHKHILDNVTLPLVIKGLSKESAQMKAEPLLKTFGLGNFSNHYPSQLSGGMRQRAALLRTFLDGKDFILLDEPFSALDLSTKKEMHLWLVDVLKKFSLTALFITHDIDESIALSDNIYILTGVPGIIANVLANSPAVDKAALKLKIVENLVY